MTAGHSDDGLQWTSRTSGTILGLRGVAAFDGGLVAVGDRGSSLPGAILVSRDRGVTWSVRPTGVLENWSSASAGHGKLVVVGGNASVLLSP